MSRRVLPGQKLRYLAAACFFVVDVAHAADETEPPVAEEPEATAVPSTPPAPAPPEEKAAAAQVVSSKWQTTFYGFLELDGMYDSTQSFGDSPANTPLQRSDGSSPAYLPIGTNPYGVTYGSKHSRTQATARNSRFGFKITPPTFLGLTSTGVVEVDFSGNQPGSPPALSESSFFSNASIRLRHAYVELEGGPVDVLFGQYYNLFGWQPLFFPGTLTFLGVPNQIFGRTPQVRISRTVASKPLSVELAVAAVRSPQRDSSLPGFEGGLRVDVNGWTGARGSGSGQPVIAPLSLGFTAVERKFRVAEFVNNRGDPTTATQVAEAYGLGFSIDAMIPVIPAPSLEDKVWALTLTGSYVKGQGISDLYTGGLTGGVQFPYPDGPNGAFTGLYGGNIDPGLVQFDLEGQLRVLNWQTSVVGFQLFLPPAGRLTLTGNFARSKSNNIARPIEQGGDPSRTFDKAEYYDANLFVDLTPALRLATSVQLIRQSFLNGGDEKNTRFELGGLFFF